MIVHIDSPGGTTAGSEELHDALRRVAAQKPMVVVVDGMAASGGYIAAMAADHIITQSTSLVGSIGVLFQFPNVSRSARDHRRQGRGDQVVPAQGRPQRARADDARRRVPRSSRWSAIPIAWFKDMVKDRRKLDGEALDRVTDGRVFTGRQAIELKLADEIGREQEAIDWLAKTNNIDPKTPVRDWRLHPRFSELSFLHLGVGENARNSWASATVVRQLEVARARCRRWKSSILTACWRFGTLRLGIRAMGSMRLVSRHRQGDCDWRSRAAVVPEPPGMVAADAVAA